MSSISNIQMKDIFSLAENIGSEIKQCEYLEQSAQKCVDNLYEEFAESIVLARLFLTLSYMQLEDWDCEKGFCVHRG